MVLYCEVFKWQKYTHTRHDRKHVCIHRKTLSLLVLSYSTMSISIPILVCTTMA
jgi:hypothetical protein